MAQIQSATIDEKIFESLTNEQHVKVLLYLERYNPDVTIEDLRHDLNMSPTSTVDALNSLSKVGLITEKNRLFKLTDYGKFVISKM